MPLARFAYLPLITYPEPVSDDAIEAAIEVAVDCRSDLTRDCSNAAGLIAIRAGWRWAPMIGWKTGGLVS